MKLTDDQQAMILACARELDAAGIDFILVAGKDREAVVMANVCPGCAADLLASARSEAIAAHDRGEGNVNMAATLQ